MSEITPAHQGLSYGFWGGLRMGAKRQNVKSAAIDAHERAKDYLEEVEIEKLLRRMADMARATICYCS
jgi:hypothetical protein